MENFRSVINENGFLVYTIVGTSMMPLLRQRKDTVHLVKIDRPLKKKDVILYQRDSGQYVLHRLVKVKDGKYVICGDNQWRREYGITDKHIIAVMEGFYRMEKYHSIHSFSYKLYKTFGVTLLRPFRFFRDFLYKVYHVLFKRKGK